MPTQITPNVSFTNVSREYRLKWRDEKALTECQDGILFLKWFLFCVVVVITRATCFSFSRNAFFY